MSSAAHGTHHHHLHVPGASPVHRMAPAAKILATVGFVMAVAITPRRTVLAFAVYGLVVVITAGIARIPGRILLSRLAVVVPFITFAAFLPFIAGGEQVELLGVSLATEGLWAAFNVVAKALLGAGASIILSATTPIPALLRGLAVLRVPSVVVSIVAFMFRYLDLLSDQLQRMRTAMVARGHDARWFWQAKPIANSAGAMFVRSYERGERIHYAMLARGFGGSMPELHHHHRSSHDLYAAIPPVVAWSTLTLTLVMS